jgi:hypothetical protein
LKRAKIENLDFRYEIYPGKGQLFSASIFNKNFTNPIEQISSLSETQAISYQNVNNAQNYGVELEFRTLAKRVIGEEITVTAPITETGQFDLFGTQSLLEIQTPIQTSELKTIATEKPNYHLITNSEERAELLELLLKQTSVCFDTETTNLKLARVSFSNAA